MAANIINGNEIALAIRKEVASKIRKLKAAGKRIPGLTVVLVGENPASMTYVASKEKMCGRVGLLSNVIRLPQETTQAQLLSIVEQLNTDAAVDGILVQLPLPKHIHTESVINAISPQKDVDGFHVINSGGLLSGIESLEPCTPAGIIEMLRRENIAIDGKHAVVIGRSNIVGKPVALMLLRENATVTICHSRTQNLADITRQADILVVAIGRANFVTADMIKPGAVVIDVGMNRAEGKLCGDVDYNAAEQVAGYITPVPGGVGPVTIAMLLKNTLAAYEKING